MKKIRKYLNSEIMMWIAVGFSLLSLIMMFVPAINGKQINSCFDLFFNRPGLDLPIGNWPSFLGYMLILAALIILIIMALPFVKPTLKVEKIVLGIVIVFLLSGSILTIITYNVSLAMNNVVINIYSPNAGGYLAGAFALLAMGSTLYALILDL